MFTGIVEEIGVLASSDKLDDDGAGQPDRPVRLVFNTSAVLDGTSIGDSISVNGCCLTVVDIGPGWWAADAVPETLHRTNLDDVNPGDTVNLERPLSIGSRLGGHLVQGHVDGVGLVASPAPDLRITAPAAVIRYLVEKGSVTIDGVSLTVVTVDEDSFTVAVIPHTMAVTTLGRRVAGERVNLEVDVIAKYAERLLNGGAESPYSLLGPPSGKA